MPQIDKPWGYEELLEHTDITLEKGVNPVAVKHVHIDGEEMTSTHRHRQTNVFLYVINGLVEIQLADDVIQLEQGDSYFIEKNTEHQILNLDSDVAELLEFLLPFTPGDIEREDDPYHRSP